MQNASKNVSKDVSLSIVIKGAGNSASSLTWALQSIEVCAKVECFAHGEFVIDAESQLGELLEIQGCCTPSGSGDDSALARAGYVAGAHVAVRGLPEIDALIEHIERARRTLGAN